MLYVVLFSSLITLLGSGWQLWEIYNRDRRQIIAQLQQIEKVYLPSIAEGLWAADRIGLATLLKGVSSIRDISYIEIREKGRKWLASGKQGAESSRRIIINKPIFYRHRNRRIRIGTLIVHASLERAWDDVVKQVWTILVSNAIKTFLVSGFLLLLFGRLVTRHLQHIARHADQLGVDSLDRSLQLERRQRPGQERDELAMVVDALNRMQNNLRDALEEMAYQRYALEQSVLLDVTAPDGCISYVNDYFCKATGYAREELVGRDHRLLRSGVHDKSFFTALWSTIAAGQIWRGEICNRARDGSLIWLDTTITPQCDDQGRILRYTAIRKVITERKKAEKALERHVLRWQRLTELGLRMSGQPDEVFERMTGMLAQMFGVSRVFLADIARDGMAIRAVAGEGLVKTPEHGSHWPVPSLFQQHIDRGRHSMLDVRVDRESLAFIRGRNGYWLNACLAFGHEDDAIAVIGLLSDKALSLVPADVDLLRICARRVATELEHEHERTQQGRLRLQLQHAQKMESLGMLAGGIAHDFNNMLASIMGYTSLAQERCRECDDDKLREYLSQVLKASERARDLIRQMLIFSRGRVEASEPVRLAPLIKEAGHMLRSMIPATIDIRVDIPDEDLWVAIDPVSLHQVVMNLCVNARDAIGDSGHIVIGCHRVRRREGVCVSCAMDIDDGEYIELSVSDDGEGIPANIVGRLFEPFFTTKDVGKGTGMGLAMVHSIVHQCGGHLLLESSPGEGSCFRLCMPPARPRTNEDNDRVSRQLPMERIGEGRRVMIVDDETAVARFLAELLGNWGFSTVTASDGQVALAHFRSDCAGFDIVIVDQAMPGMSGMALAGEIAAIRPDLPIVLCTGNPGQLDETAKPAAIRQVLTKPVDIDSLARVLRKVLAV